MAKKKRKLRGLCLVLSLVLSIGFCLSGIPAKKIFAEPDESADQEEVNQKDLVDQEEIAQKDPADQEEIAQKDPAGQKDVDQKDIIQRDPGDDQNGQNNARQIQIKFAGKDKGNGKYEFEVDDIVFTVTFMIGDTVSDTINKAKDTWTVTEDDNAKIRLSETFDRDNYDVVLESVTDDFSATLLMTGDNEALVFDDSYHLQDTMQLAFVKKNNGGEPEPGPGPQDNSVAVINISAPEGSWNLTPMVREPYDVVNSDDSCSAPYSRFAFVADLSINGGHRTESIGHYDKDADIAGLETQEIGFNKGVDDTTARFTFSTNWSNRIESVIINNKSYDITLDYDDRYSWLLAFGGQNISFDIDVDIPQPDADGKYVFDVQLKVRPITEKECFIGNFLWSKDEHFSPEGPDPSDLYIGHSSLLLESVDFDNGHEKIHWQIDAEDDGTNREYSYESNGVKYDYAHFSMKYPENDCSMGEMVIPEGAEVVMKIVPEYGYQVKSFSGVDFEAGNVKLQGGECEFTFIIGKGNFHIGARVEKQEDDAVSSSKTVTEGGVLIPEGLIDSGSARLSITDAELSKAKVEKFDEVAEENGYKVSSLLELDLNQVFFQGTGNDNDVWSDPIDLDGLGEDDYVTVGLKLPDGIDLDKAAIIHNIDNGEEFEVIEFEDAVEDMSVFKTKGFSSYAIAVESENEDPTDEPTDEPTEEPTDEPTEEPTDEPTEEPTEEPEKKRISVTDDETGIKVSFLAPDDAENYMLDIEDGIAGVDEATIAWFREYCEIPDEYDLYSAPCIRIISSDPNEDITYYERNPVTYIPMSEDILNNYDIRVLYLYGDEESKQYKYSDFAIEDGMLVIDEELDGTFIILVAAKEAEEDVTEATTEASTTKEAEVETTEATTEAITEPQTGDSSDPALMFILLFVSAGMLILSVKKSKERSDR